MGSPTTGAVTAVGVLFSIIAVFSFAIRIYSNRKYQKTIEIDDWLILPAFLLSLTAGVAMIIGGQTNIIGGHSLPMITPEQNARVGKFEYSFWIGHVLIMCFIKLSILFFFRRLFMSRAKRSAFDIVNWTLIAIVIAWTIAFIFCDAFACGIHPQYTWTTKFWLADKCFDTSAMMLGSSTSNWILDLAIFIEPLVMIGKLHMNTKKKLQLCAMFLFSAFAVVAGLLRVIVWIGVYTHGLKTVKFFGVTLSTGDVQAVATYSVFWTYIEIGVSFMVACLLPAAKVLDALKVMPMFYRLQSISSSIFRTRRSNASAREKDPEAQSEESWSVHDHPKDSNSMRHYDNELRALASTIDRSGNHGQSVCEAGDETYRSSSVDGFAHGGEKILVTREVQQNASPV